MARLLCLASAFAACLVLAVSWSSGGALAQQRSAAHEFCAMQWASEDAKRAQCVNRQISAVQSIVRYLDWAKASPGPDGEHVVSTFEFCQGRWAPDFYLVDNCLRARALIAPPQ